MDNSITTFVCPLTGDEYYRVPRTLPVGAYLEYTTGCGWSCMPNGGSHDHGTMPDPASPIHTSDDEEIYESKMRHRVLVFWVFKRWKLFLRRKRWDKFVNWILRLLCLRQIKNPSGQ
jgi:hypothetical protein